MSTYIEKIIENQKKSLHIVFKDTLYIVFAISLALNFVALDYVIFSQSTTFRIFFSQNSLFYNRTSIILSLLIAVLFGISITMVAFILKQRKKNPEQSTGSSILGSIFGVIAS